MRKQRNGSGDLDPRSEVLFRILIEDYDRAINFPVGSEKFDITPDGNIITYARKPGFWNQLFGIEQENTLWFFDICMDIKNAMMKDPSIRNENAKKKLEERLLSAFKTQDKNSLINWLFAVTLNLSNDKDNGNNNGNNNNNNNNDKGNNKGNNQKQDPPKRDKANNDGNGYGFGNVAIPLRGYYPPYQQKNTQQSNQQVVNPYDNRRMLPDYLILPEGRIFSNKRDDDTIDITIEIEEED